MQAALLPGLALVVVKLLTLVKWKVREELSLQAVRNRNNFAIADLSAIFQASMKI